MRDRLTWPHLIKARHGGWDEPVESDVREMLDKEVSSIEEKLNDVLRQSGGRLDLRIQVDRDRFPDSRGKRTWIRFAPFTIAFKGEIRLPWLPFHVAIKGVTIDFEGWHWPTELRTWYETTFAIGPHCAVSDPCVTVRATSDSVEQLLLGNPSVLADWEIHIGGKFTPPVIPLGTILKTAARVNPNPLQGQLTSEQIEEVALCLWIDLKVLRAIGPLRLDNPWLHCVFLEGDFGGRLHDPLLHGDAKLVLLGSQAMALPRQTGSSAASSSWLELPRESRCPTACPSSLEQCNWTAAMDSRWRAKRRLLESASTES